MGLSARDFMLVRKVSSGMGDIVQVGSHDPIFGTNYLLRFKEISHANQHFYKLKL